MTETMDLSTLPPPEIIEEISHQAIVDRQTAKFQEVWASVRAAHPEADLPAYDTALMAYEPPAISNEVESYRETLLRARINEAIKAYMLPFAKKGDLDMLAAFYGVIRMLGEQDERLRRRVVLAIQGRSTGGTVPRYRYIAMSADITVENALVYTVKRSPLLHVAVFSTAPDGLATPALINKVSDALHVPEVIMANDTFAVATAVRTVINPVADVWLLPDAPADTIVHMELALRSAWDAAQALGRDFVRSWWVSKLMIPGVHKVTSLLLDDIEVPPNEAVAIGTVTLNLVGRAY